MLLDHIGYRMYSVPGLREIGRIAFPIFAFMIASGASKTRNIYRYFLRLVVFGCLSEVIYDRYFYGSLTWSSQNMMFTLALGLAGIIFYKELKPEKTWEKALALLPAVFFALLSDAIGSDYGVWGVALVVALYLFDGSEIWKKIMTALSVAVFSARFFVLYLAKRGLAALLTAVGAQGLITFSVTAPSAWNLTQMYAVLSLIFILSYNGKRGAEIRNPVWRKVYQYSFYAFYPVHLLILALIFLH